MAPAPEKVAGDVRASVKVPAALIYAALSLLCGATGYAIPRLTDPAAPPTRAPVEILERLGAVERTLQANAVEKAGRDATLDLTLRELTKRVEDLTAEVRALRGRR